MFKIQMQLANGDWDDCLWDEGETLAKFDTPEEAQAEIDDLIQSTQAAFNDGHMDEAYDPNSYRVVPV